MIRTTRAKFGALAATGMMIAGVATFSLTASGQAPPAPIEADPFLIPLGTLTIQLTDRAGTVVFDPVAPGLNVTQTIVTTQPCSAVGFLPISPTVTGNLLALQGVADDGTQTTSPDTVQLPGSALGVHTDTNCGTPAGLIGPRETMTIGLGNFFGADVRAKSTFLSIGKSFNTDRDVFVGFDGVEEATARAINVGGSTFTVTPTVPFRNMTLRSTATQNSRGVSVRSTTSFELVTASPTEAEVFCSEKVTRSGDANHSGTDAVFVRGEPNTNKQGDPCDDVKVTLDITSITTGATSTKVVYWDNTTVGLNDNKPQVVNGTITIDWAPVLAADSAQLNRQIDYDGPGIAAGFTDTLYCTSFASATNALGKVTYNVVLPDYTGPGAILVDHDNNLGTPKVSKAPWCLVSDTRVLGADGNITQTEVLYGSGDPLRK